MRITGNDGERLGLGGTQQSSKSGKVTGSRGGSSTQSGGSSVDKVDVSSTGEILHQALSLDAQQRSDKVASLTQMYRNGTLEVDPEKLSAAILSEARKTRSEE